MLYSKYDVGPVGVSRLVAYPRLMSRMPLAIKDKIRVRAVRSAGSSWLPARLASVKISTGRSVTAANSAGNEVQLKLDDGTERRVDHVLMGTGYEVDIARYDFLSVELLEAVRRLLASIQILQPGSALLFRAYTLLEPRPPASLDPLNFVAGTDFASRHLRPISADTE